MFLGLIIKFLAQINLFLGRIIRKRRRLDPAGIKSILVNRADRLGDAIVSLPFLLELSKRFDVTVLTSKYNDVVLNKFLKTEVFSETPATFLVSIRMIFIGIFGFLRVKKPAVSSRYDLYLDLMGIRGQDIFLKVREKNLCRYYLGFNLGMGNLFLDYADSKNPALFAGSNLVDSYRRLLKTGLGLDLDVPDYADLKSAMSKPDDFNLSPPFVLVNISGYNKFRGPSAQSYARIVNETEFSGTFIIMDDRDCPDIPAFKKYVEKSNVCYLEDKYSLWQLYYIARASTLYIGSDSGISQFLGGASHCVILFGTGEHRVWRPYSRNPYKKKNIDGLVVEEGRNSAGHIKKIIYAPVWCRPCFDFGCRNFRCIKRMDGEVLAEELTITLRDISGCSK